jgi:shikimate dehydrogenase
MKKYAVFGNPIKHSMSPVIHAYFAKNLGIELSYEAILGTIGKFEDEAKDFLKKGGSGFNITLPFKQEAYNIADIKSDVAEITGSVNTISVSQGRIHGDNTDGSGFIKDIKNNIGYDLGGKKVLLLGAGGAGMGIVPNIIYENPSEFKIYNRTFKKAERLCNKFSEIGYINAISADELKKNKFDIIINSTSAGMSNSDFYLPDNIIRNDGIFYDLSYGTATNFFRNWAEKNKLLFYDGLGMLLEQAADSFYIWESKRPLITDELKSILSKKL